MSNTTMKNSEYWKKYYVIETNSNEIERSIKMTRFSSGANQYDLVSFVKNKEASNILISPGSGGHAFVFAELGYQMHLKGYNVFVMPRHGGVTISELLPRHHDALRHIGSNYNNRIGVFGEGLGGFATFYLSLAGGQMKSAAYQNAPVIMTEKKFQDAMKVGGGAARRRRMLLPFVKVLSRILPRIKLPIRFYLDFKEMVDSKKENREIEAPLIERFSKDPDFDKRYPLSAIMSLVTTPPPNALSTLKIPTMFIVPMRGFFPSYETDLFNRLPDIRKEMIEVDGGVFWMLSHPKEAARLICEWFDETV